MKIIFLTACVDPSGMKFTILQDKNKRLNQYLDAIRFYYDNTPFKILVVENTNYDMSVLLPHDNDRIEFLTFKGNGYDINLGKGYGEAEIIKYAAQHSKFYSEAETIIKITGRDKVKNVMALIKEIKDTSSVYSDICSRDGHLTCQSRFVVFPQSFLNDCFLPNSNKINDSKLYYFEDLLFDMSKGRLKEFRHPILTETVSGSTGERISPTLSQRIKAPVKYYMHKLGLYIVRF